MAARRDAGPGAITVVPDFGPPPYAHAHPGNGAPLVDVAPVCDALMGLLARRYGAAAGWPAPPAGGGDCTTPCTT